MVHEVLTYDTDSDFVDDEERDELDQDPLMNIEDRVKPAELKSMAVRDLCGASYCSNPQRHEKLTPERPYSRWSNRLKPGVSKR